MTMPNDMTAFNAEVIAAFRAGGGHGEHGPVSFESLVLLTTTGRVSGAPHVTPLGFAHDADGNLILFGSNMGSPDEPDWVANIRENPSVRVEITGRDWDGTAVILTGEARGDAYQRWVDIAPDTAGHENAAGREIPMILLPVP